MKFLIRIFIFSMTLFLFPNSVRPGVSSSIGEKVSGAVNAGIDLCEIRFNLVRSATNGLASLYNGDVNRWKVAFGLTVGATAVCYTYNKCKNWVVCRRKMRQLINDLIAKDMVYPLYINDNKKLVKENAEKYQIFPFVLDKALLDLVLEFYKIRDIALKTQKKSEELEIKGKLIQRYLWGIPANCC